MVQYRWKVLVFRLPENYGFILGGRDGIRTRINGATWALPQAKPVVGNARQQRPVIGAAACILNRTDKPTSA
ncbi:MAG: hypothetical protein Q4E77_06020 [Conchiformibius sp.]|nr:hypothetical protein [Conchiformibius sp.]